MTARPTIDFWYDFASSYSYLSVMRVAALAEAAGVDVRWRPFLLGPIFAAQGWSTSPFNLYPAKGRYMWRDMERLCERRGLSLKRPSPFPQNSLAAARVAIAGRDQGWIAGFSRALFAMAFGEGKNIADEAVLTAALRAADIDPNAAMVAARSEEVKGRLRAETELAKSLGVFGAPSFITGDGEIFWGDDRLEHAIGWARGD
ncbi:MAG: disulfide bond formation protein DsbA [Rhizobiales bacterium 65-9]|nr:2-hydroxychromene-2-carboxylate isomerase [Hyphomicrobiales bacterium]OJY37286.1 MAG: disulfide bond formation protein DsbA [Rhizobiales bacterium 65-9]